MNRPIVSVGKCIYIHHLTILLSFSQLQGNCAKVTSINDKRDWKIVKNALSVIEFSDMDVEVMFSFKLKSLIVM